MIIILHGKDNYRSDKKLKEIVAGYKKKNPTGLNLIYLKKKLDFNDLKTESGQIGMFKEKRLLIGKGLLEDKDLKKEIEKNLEELAESENILILKEEDKVSGKLVKKVEKMDKKKGVVQEYPKLKGKKLESWYAKEFKEREAKIKSRAVRKLIEYVKDDLWRAENEIEKLSLMRKGEEITVEDVSEHVRPDIDGDIFKMIDFLGKGNKKGAIELFQDHMKRGDSPFYLLSMIDYQVRNLLAVKDLEDLSYNEMKKKSGLSPFVFKKSHSQARRFDFSKLKKIHDTLFAVDLDIKLGKITPETGIVLVISRF